MRPLEPSRSGSKGKLLDAFGVQLEYFEQGQGEPVVLLHCTGGSAAQWNALAGQLAESHHVVAVNLHGYGETSDWDGRAAFRLRHEVELLEQLLRQTLRGPAHFVGHSYGGAVALAFSRSMPECVRSLSLFEPASFHLLRAGDDLDFAAFQEIAQVARTVWDALESGEYVLGARYFVDYWSSCGAWARLPAQRKQGLIARLPKIGLNFQATMNDPAGLDAMRELRMPRLVMHGEHSTLPAHRVCRALATAWTDALHCTVLGAGHMGPVSHAAHVNQLIAGFLREQGSMQRGTAPGHGATSPGVLHVRA
jgi:pimeloyl-ACP methyl ester carboxylesterase